MQLLQLTTADVRRMVKTLTTAGMTLEKALTEISYGYKVPVEFLRAIVGTGVSSKRRK